MSEHTLAEARHATSANDARDTIFLIQNRHAALTLISTASFNHLGRYRLHVFVLINSAASTPLLFCRPVHHLLPRSKQNIRTVLFKISLRTRRREKKQNVFVPRLSPRPARSLSTDPSAPRLSFDVDRQHPLQCTAPCLY